MCIRDRALTEYYDLIVVNKQKKRLRKELEDSLSEVPEKHRKKFLEMYDAKYDD